MANLLDKYGIKEVADVTFFTLSNGQPDYSKPVLFLDTLKVSTIEQTAENTSARGGKGNPELISWDYGKEITVTLEDALFSAKSMAFMFGVDKSGADTTSAVITRAVPIGELDYDTTSSSWGIKVATSTGGTKIEKATTITFFDKSGASTTAPSDATALAGATNVAYAVVTITSHHSVTIEINADKYPGTYYVVGDTYARPKGSSKDEYFQFIIPEAKVSSEVTITMEAEGDPSTFNMNLRVLRPTTGDMMKLVKYDFD